MGQIAQLILDFSSFNLNFCSIFSQECGFTPIWIPSCHFMTCCSLNFLLQKLQEYGFSPVWIHTCWLIDFVFLNLLKAFHKYELSHVPSTGFIFSPIYSLYCFKKYSCKELVSQISHWSGSYFSMNGQCITFHRRHELKLITTYVTFLRFISFMNWFYMTFQIFFSINMYLSINIFYHTELFVTIFAWIRFFTHMNPLMLFHFFFQSKLLATVGTGV